MHENQKVTNELVAVEHPKTAFDNTEKANNEVKDLTHEARGSPKAEETKRSNPRVGKGASKVTIDG